MITQKAEFEKRKCLIQLTKTRLERIIIKYGSMPGGCVPAAVSARFGRAERETER